MVMYYLRHMVFLLTPLREGRQKFLHQLEAQCDFYSRPCGRGDRRLPEIMREMQRFLLTPLREGRPRGKIPACTLELFLLTPLREGRPDASVISARYAVPFLLTPLREGRLHGLCDPAHVPSISTHAPAGGATRCNTRVGLGLFDFYSRPCGRGDVWLMVRH